MELKPAYFGWSVKNLQRAAEESKIVDLFQFASMEAAAAAD